MWVFHMLLKKKKKNNNKNKQQRVEGRKDKHGFRTAKCRKLKLALFYIQSMYIWLSWQFSKILYSYQRCWLISGHRLHCFVSSFLTPYHPPIALDPRLRADWPAPHLGLESLTLCSGVSPLTDQCPSSSLTVSQVFTGTALCVVFMPK